MDSVASHCVCNQLPMCGLHSKIISIYESGCCVVLLMADGRWWHITRKKGRKGREKTQDKGEKAVKVFNSGQEQINQSKLFSKKKKKKCKGKIYHRKPLLPHHTFYLWRFFFFFLTYKHCFLTHPWTRSLGRSDASQVLEFQHLARRPCVIGCFEYGGRGILEKQHLSVSQAGLGGKGLPEFPHMIQIRGCHKGASGTLGNIVCLCLVKVPWVLVLILVLSCTYMFLYLSEHMVELTSFLKGVWGTL